MGTYDFVSTETTSEEGENRERDALRALEKVYEKGEISLEEYDHLKNVILTERNEETIKSTEAQPRIEAKEKTPTKKSLLMI